MRLLLSCLLALSPGSPAWAGAARGLKAVALPKAPALPASGLDAADLPPVSVSLVPEPAPVLKALAAPEAFVPALWNAQAPAEAVSGQAAALFDAAPQAASIESAAPAAAAAAVPSLPAAVGAGLPGSASLAFSMPSPRAKRAPSPSWKPAALAAGAVVLTSLLGDAGAALSVLGLIGALSANPAFRPDSPSPSTATGKAKTYSTSSGDAPFDFIEERGREKRLDDASRDVARFWLSRTLEDASKGTDGAFELASADEPDGRRHVFALTASAAGAFFPPEALTKLRGAQTELSSVIEAVPGAAYGLRAYAGSGKERARLVLWLALPRSGEGPQLADAGAPSAAPRAAALALAAVRPAAAGAYAGVLDLAQRLLDSDSPSSRLLGLHVAASALPEEGFKSVASAMRGLRTGGPKEAALFAELERRAPTGLSSHRDGLKAAFADRVFALSKEAREAKNDDVQDRESLGAIYGNLMRRLGLTLTDQDSAAAARAADHVRRRIRRMALVYGLVQALLLKLGDWAYNWWDWNFWFVLVASIILSVINWGVFAATRADAVAYVRTNAALLDDLLAKGGAERERLAVGLRRLKQAAGRKPGRSQYLGRDAAYSGAAKTPQGQAVVEGWLTRLERFFADGKAQRRDPALSYNSNSLASLARLHASLNEAQRRRAVALLLTPLRDRWLPSYREDYARGLKDFLENVELTPSELDSALEAVTALPVDLRGSVAQWTEVLPILEGLSRQPLDAGQRAALEQLLSSYAVEQYAAALSEQSRRRVDYIQFSPYVDAARVRGRLIPPAQAWESAREAIESLAPERWEFEDFRAIAMFVGEDPGAAPVWLKAPLEAALKRQSESNAFWGRYALARLEKSPVKRAERLVGLLSWANTGKMDAEDSYYNDLLADLHAAVAEARGAGLK